MRRGSAAAHLLGIACSNPVVGMDVSCECFVLQGRGLCSATGRSLVQTSPTEGVGATERNHVKQ